jgi:UDP-4-amino-4,6-dideoxy-N-acetyl-beta-L-altrosamine transaminase
MIPYGCHEITKADIDAVVEVLQSGYLTQGPAVPKFEKAVSDNVGVKYALAVNSATSALHIACLSLGLDSGDWLWTSPITFVASANCAIYCNAQVDFVDIDPNTYNISLYALEEKLIIAKKTGRLPKVLVAVHLCGQPCEMAQIYSLAQKYGFKVIEDASHAIGGKYKGEFIGNCRYSDITVFSFHPVKIITTAEGGMVLTNSDELAVKLALLRSHGITRDNGCMTKTSDGPWYYEQISMGFNYRMTDVHAALGISQIERLKAYVSHRHTLADAYNKLLADLPIILPWQHPDSYSAYHLYVIRLKLCSITKTRRQVFDDLRNEGIGVNIHYIPVHTQPYYQRLGFKIGDFPNAEKYYAEAISLPIFQTLTSVQLEQVVSALNRILMA